MEKENSNNDIVSMTLTKEIIDGFIHDPWGGVIDGYDGHLANAIVQSYTGKEIFQWRQRWRLHTHHTEDYLIYYWCAPIDDEEHGGEAAYEFINYIDLAKEINERLNGKPMEFDYNGTHYKAIMRY